MAAAAAAAASTLARAAVSSSNISLQIQGRNRNYQKGKFMKWLSLSSVPSKYTGNEITLYWQIGKFVALSTILNIQAYLVWGVATFSNTRYWSFDFFQYKVIYHSNTRFTLYWKKVSMMSRTTNTCLPMFQDSGGQDCTNKDGVKSNTR